MGRLIKRGHLVSQHEMKITTDAINRLLSIRGELRIEMIHQYDAYKGN